MKKPFWFRFSFLLLVYESPCSCSTFLFTSPPLLAHFWDSDSSTHVPSTDLHLGAPQTHTHTQPAPNWTYSFPLNLLPFQCPLLTQQLHIPSIQSFKTEIWGAILDPNPPPPTQYPPADLMKIPGTPLLSTSMASMPTVFFIRSANIYWLPPGCHALG